MLWELMEEMLTLTVAVQRTCFQVCALRYENLLRDAGHGTVPLNEEKVILSKRVIAIEEEIRVLKEKNTELIKCNTNLVRLFEGVQVRRAVLKDDNTRLSRRVTKAEARATAAEARATAAETRATAAETRATAAEHQVYYM